MEFLVIHDNQHEVWYEWVDLDNEGIVPEDEFCSNLDHAFILLDKGDVDRLGAFLSKSP